jgi:hypothetical protein
MTGAPSSKLMGSKNVTLFVVFVFEFIKQVFYPQKGTLSSLLFVLVFVQQ